jgi:hypothetical protein
MNKRRLQSLFAIIMLSALSTASAAVVPLMQGIPPGPDLSPGDIGIFANPVEYGSTGFDQIWFFQLTSPSNLKGEWDSLLINDPHVDLIYYVGSTYQKDYNHLPKNFTLTSLLAGDYELEIMGDTGNADGEYFGGFKVTAVPLPGAAWLLLSGLAGLGVLARRRRVGHVA